MFSDLRNVARERPVWRRIVAQLRPFAGRLTVLFALVVVTVGASLALPFLYREALDVVVRGRTSAGGRSLDVVALLVLVVGLVQVAAAFGEQRLRAALGEDMAAATRDRLFDHLQRVPYSFFIHANPGALSQRIWDEAARAGLSVVFVVTEGCRALLTLTVAPALVAAYDLRLAGVLAFLGLFLLPSSLVRRRIRTAITEQVIVQSRYGGLIFERLSVAGALLTRVFGLHKANRAQLANHAQRYRDLGVSAGTWQAFNQALIGTGLAIGVGAVIWVGGRAVVAGSMTIGELALLLFYLRMLAVPIQNYSQIRFELIRGFVAFGRLFEVLDLKQDPRPAEDAGTVPPSPGLVEFNHVSFRYPTARESVPPSLAMADAPPELDAKPGSDLVLDDVSFRLQPGAFVALAGSSGSGKSTIAALAAGLFPSSSGVVEVGGTDLGSLGDEALRRAVGLVTQDTHLIHETIRANLLLARPDATDKEVVKACVAAGIHKFIRSLPNGYGTVVGERGVRLSGGQRQRLAFARILLLDPAVVILDEATAHLDTESESLLREAVDRVLAGRTRLVIAHRLSTIVNADEILVLEDGRIVERGSHEALMTAGGRYEQLYRNQFLRSPHIDDDLTEAPIGTT
jgi:ATP-binding cassette subfamily B protein